MGGRLAFVRNNAQKKIMDAFSRVPREDMFPIMKEAFDPAIMLMLNKARSLAPWRTGRMALSIKPTKFSERFRENKSVWRQGIRMGTRARLGIAEDASGYYPASMEFGFKFPPATEEEANSSRYVRKERKNPFAGMERNAQGKFTGKKANPAKAQEAPKPPKRHIGGHTYFDKVSGQFRKSPTSWKWGGKPFMRPALYNNVGAIMSLMRNRLSMSIPAAFKERIGST